MSVDRLLQARAAEGRPLRVGLYGAGFMARGIVNQIAHAVPGMRLAVICNRSVDKAIEAYPRPASKPSAWTMRPPCRGRSPPAHRPSPTTPRCCMAAMRWIA